MTLKNGNGRVFDSPEWSYVYLLRQGDLYKIGISIHPEVRSKTFGELIYSFHAHYPRVVERMLMDRFAGKRRRLDKYASGYTEWFVLTQEDVDWVRGYKNEWPHDCGIWLS